MSFRTKLNANPALGAAASIVVVAIAAGVLWWSLKPSEFGPPTKSFFTVDEGKNLFEDSANKVSFDKDGKLAVRAYVYTCDAGSTRFVAYLERLPEGAEAPPPAADQPKPAQAAPAKNEAEARARAAQAPKVTMGKFVTLVKKPGDKDWIKPGDANYFSTISPACPGGKGTLDRVFP